MGNTGRVLAQIFYAYDQLLRSVAKFIYFENFFQ